jgi:hypothetical protein
MWYLEMLNCSGKEKACVSWLFPDDNLGMRLIGFQLHQLAKLTAVPALQKIKF